MALQIKRGNSTNLATLNLEAGELAFILDKGKLDLSVIPSDEIINPLPAANEAAMLALDAEPGDVALRADNGKAYMLFDSPASTKSNWVQITAEVVTAASIGLGNVKVATDLDSANMTQSVIMGQDGKPLSVNEAIGSLSSNLVKTGQKREEKNFLGYEFSERRGHEGTKHLPNGTKLFDENGDLLNPQKANSYIYSPVLSRG